MPHSQKFLQKASYETVTPHSLCSVVNQETRVEIRYKTQVKPDKDHTANFVLAECSCDH